MRRSIQTCQAALLTTLFVLVSTAPLVFAVVPNVAADGLNTRSSISRVATDLANPPAANCAQLTSCDVITQYVDPTIKLLTALVGVGVLTSIIIGGIQYSSSGGDPSKASAAKNRIRNAIIALVAFILLSAMLNFLIPGGLV
jgi:hypothetical protein